MDYRPCRIVRPLGPLAPSEVGAFVRSPGPLSHRPGVLLERWDALRGIVLASPHAQAGPLEAVGEFLVARTAAPCQVPRLPVRLVPIEVHYPKVFSGTAQNAAFSALDVLLCPVALRPVCQVPLNLGTELDRYQHGQTAAFPQRRVNGLKQLRVQQPGRTFHMNMRLQTKHFTKTRFWRMFQPKLTPIIERSVWTMNATCLVSQNVMMSPKGAM
jgi:hypothetical protein